MNTPPTPVKPNIIKILSFLIFKRFEVLSILLIAIIPVSVLSPSFPTCQGVPSTTRLYHRKHHMCIRLQDGLGGREHTGTSMPRPARQPLLLLGHSPTMLPMEGEPEVEELENDNRDDNRNCAPVFERKIHLILSFSK